MGRDWTRNRLREKAGLIFRATKHHASNLARFASIYKISMLVLKHYGPTPGKEGMRQCPPPPYKKRKKKEKGGNTDPCSCMFPGPYDSFMAGLVGGYFVFGQRSPRTGKISSINQQIVVYIFARCCLALARLSVKPGVGLPRVSGEPLRSKISHYAWPAFASLSWATVMMLFKYHPEDLQSSLRGSMTYIYQDCDSWDSLRTLVWHNK